MRVSASSDSEYSGSGGHGAHEFRADCNQNSLFDDLEILQDPALDANGDGILDVCASAPAYDCNDNGIEDCNKNGVPEECEKQVQGFWTSATDLAPGTRINVSSLQNDTEYQLERNPTDET